MENERRECELMDCIRPDGRKKAYVRLTADHDALDVANKVRLRALSCLSKAYQNPADRLHLIDSPLV
jgi:hypothetical protein